MFMSRTISLPESNEVFEASETALGRWMVTIFNNETNQLDEVIQILISATGCDLQEAEIETWEAHTYGKAPVHFSAREECETVARTISRIGVRTEVTREWED